MQIFTVSFFGHRELDNPFNIESVLEAHILKLIKEKEYVEFLVGRDGEFDQLVSSTIRRCKSTVRGDNNALTLVLPYLTAEYHNSKESFHAYYDDVEICEVSASKHFKAAHQIRNRYMVERSDFVIFCVEHPHGGAYQTLQYAKKHETAYINISQNDI